MSSNQQNLNAIITDTTRKKRISIGFEKVPDVSDIIDVAKSNGIYGSIVYAEEDGQQITNNVYLHSHLKRGKTILVATSYEERKKLFGVITDNSRSYKISRAFEPQVTRNEFIKFAKLKGIQGDRMYCEDDGTEICDSISLRNHLQKGRTILVADSYSKVLTGIVIHNGEETTVRLATPIKMEHIHYQFQGEGHLYNAENMGLICDDETLEYCFENCYAIIKSAGQDEVDKIQMKLSGVNLN